MTKSKEEFFKILTDNSYGIICAPTSPSLGLAVLGDYLLGEDWYTASGGGAWQVNTEIVDAILSEYSREYRRDVKKLQKKLKEKNNAEE